ncbi:MAG TPA: ribosome-associated translation inhibitor RaiA [Acidimicrobiia bacterium]|nr:ribosome-associated translation inhibitor RaiA [Acidimicrobiia bacterium]
MDVVIVGKHAEVDGLLRSLTELKLERIGKFANDVKRVDVEYSELATRRAGDSHVCEILVHLNQHLVKGRASAPEHAVALDGALDKVEHQMRRLHERRVHRRNGARDRNGRDAAAAPDVVAPDEPESVIVKTKQFAVKPMHPEEAALQMELLGHDFFLFRSTESGSAAVVYRRRDGAVGLIEVTG